MTLACTCCHVRKYSSIMMGCVVNDSGNCPAVPLSSCFGSSPVGVPSESRPQYLRNTHAVHTESAECAEGTV